MSLRRLLGQVLQALAVFIVIPIIAFPTVANAANNMVIDGTPAGIQSSPGAVISSSISVNMATTRSNDILIAYVGWESGGHAPANSQSSSVVSASGTPTLTWTLRTRYQNGGDQTQEVWWAVAPTAGTYGVQINWTSQYVDDADLILFAINGANLTSPWEGTSATKLPLGSLSGSYSTTYANDFVLTFYANEWNTIPSGPLPTGINTSIINVNNSGQSWYEYNYVSGAAVSSVITTQTWGWTTTSGTANTKSAVIIDALRDANYLSQSTIGITVSDSIYRTGTVIQATFPTSPGRVTFYAMGKPIPNCKNIRVNGASTASCNWKPSGHGSIPVYASYLSNGGQALTSSTSFVNISARQTNR